MHRSMLVLPVLLLVLSVAAARNADAQSGKRFGLGAGVSFNHYADSRFPSRGLGFTPAYHVSKGHRGLDGWSWGFAGSVSIAGLNVPTEISGSPVLLGRVQTIPLLGGVARTYRQGPLNVGAFVMGGPSFNNFTIDPGATTSYEAAGSSLDAVHAKTSFAFRPGVSASYDLSSSLALQGALSYTINRPTVLTQIDGTSTSERWKLDHSSVSFGLVMGIF